MTMLCRLVLATLTALTAVATQSRPIHVAPDGAEDAAGTPAEPTTFGEALRRATPGDGARAGTAAGEATEILLAGGRYRFARGITLQNGRAITVRPQPGAQVVFDGSLPIDPSDFAPVTDPDERARLAAAAADQIVATTVTDDRIVKRLSSRVALRLVIDGRSCAPARFPNSGYAKLDGTVVEPEVSPPAVPEGREDYGVRAGRVPFVESGKPEGWLGSVDEPRGAWVRIGDRANDRAGTWSQWQSELERSNRRNLITGFLDANWLERSQSIVAADAERRAFRLATVLAYGFGWRRHDKPFYVSGLLCELDAPGEWHFDPATRRLYLHPFGDAPEDISVPVASEGFLKLSSCRDVTVESLTVERVAAGTLIQIDGGTGNRAAGLLLQNSTATGVRVSGRHNAVISCDLVDLTGHVRLAGGTRGPGRLESGGNLVENCHLYQRTFRDRRVNIGISGVGNVLRHNLIHNSLGQAVTVRGNDHVVELNEIFNVGFEEGDGGAIYSGGDLVGYGIIYRNNFIHHLMHRPGKVERSGIHLDDRQAGAICVGNVFFKSAGKGIFMNGGAGHLVLGNVFVAGARGVYNVGHGGQRMYDLERAMAADPEHASRGSKEDYVGRAERAVGSAGWNREPWRTRYPRFAQVMNDAGPFGRQWPIRCVVRDNVFCDNSKGDGTIWSRVAPEARAKSVLEGDRAVERGVFRDVDVLDLRFREPKAGLPSIPFATIGLRIDRYRLRRPDPRAYRGELREFYRGVPSMPGTDRLIDTAPLVEGAPRIAR